MHILSYDKEYDFQMNNSKLVGFERLIWKKKKKKFAAALQKTCELIWVPAYECCIKISKQTAAIAKNR